MVFHRALSVIFLVLCCGLSASRAHADDETENIQTIVNQLIEAHGGRSQLLSMQQYLVEYDVTNTHIQQSFKPNAPWDISKEHNVYQIDYANQVSVEHRNAGFREGSYSARYAYDGTRYFSTDDGQKTVSINTKRNFQSSTDYVSLLNSTLIIRRLLDDNLKAGFAIDHGYDDALHYVIQFELPSDPDITLFVNKHSFLIDKIQRETASRLYQYTYGDYKKVKGIDFPFSTKLEITIKQGASVTNPKRLFVAERIELDQPIAKTSLIIPTDFRVLKRTSTDPSPVLNVGNGTYWVKHSFHNSLFVEFEDHLMMVGALRGANERIKQIKTLFPDKPIKYAVITHHHEDHIGGSDEIVDAGITLIVSKAHQEAVLNALSENNKLKAKFFVIHKKQIFEDKTQRVELYDIGPTPHTEHFLLAYLPQQRLVFEADHFTDYGFGVPAVANPNVTAFANELIRLGLPVSQIASAHGARIVTFAEMMKAYSAVKKIK